MGPPALSRQSPQKTFSIICLGIFILTLFGIPFFAEGAADKTELASVEFTKGISLQEGLELIRANGLTPLLAEHAFMDGDRVATGFVGIDAEKSAKEMELEAVKRHNSFLELRKDMYVKEENDRPDLSTEAKEDLLQRAQKMKDIKPLTNMDVTKMTVVGSIDALEGIKNDSRIHNLEVKKQKTSFTNVLSFLQYWVAPPKAVADIYVNPETWIPEYGGSWTGQYPYEPYNDERYIYQDMWWDDVSGFFRYATYEHEFFLYNYDRPQPHYFDQGASYWGFPNITYGASDLPLAFLDTRFGDSFIGGTLDELSYTVGAGYAETIAQRNWYYTFLMTEEGSASSDRAKLQGQLGYRNPTFCYTTWCSFGEQHERIVSPTWSVPVPGFLDWRF